jgi:hypothetical protein
MASNGRPKRNLDEIIVKLPCQLADLGTTRQQLHWYNIRLWKEQGMIITHKGGAYRLFQEVRVQSA